MVFDCCQGGYQYGEDFCEDCVEVDEEDQLVFVDQVFDGYLVKGYGGVIECQCFWGCVLLGEEVVWLYEVDVCFQCFLGEFDVYG